MLVGSLGALTEDRDRIVTVLPYSGADSLLNEFAVVALAR